MNNDDFCAGVKILLQRMETNPEEFYKTLIPNSYESIYDVKWQNIMQEVMKSKLEGKKLASTWFLTDAEVDALHDGYTLIRRKAFDDSVMRELLVTEDKSDGVKLSSIPHPIRTGTSNNDMNQILNSHIQQHQCEQARMMGLQGVANSAAQAQGLQNAYPYTPYTPEPRHPEPAPASLLKQMAKAVGLK